MMNRALCLSISYRIVPITATAVQKVREPRDLVAFSVVAESSILSGVTAS